MKTNKRLFIQKYVIIQQFNLEENNFVLSQYQHTNEIKLNDSQITIYVIYFFVTNGIANCSIKLNWSAVISIFPSTDKSTLEQVILYGMVLWSHDRIVISSLQSDR